MRWVRVKTARFVAFAVASTTAAGLVATLPPASQAATSHLVARNRAPARLAPAGPSRLAAAELIAARARPHGDRAPMAPAGAASAAQVSARARTGMITGLVRSGTGRPFDGACVSASGPAGSAIARTKPNGRYFLTGLRPGRYRMRVASCATSRAAGSAMISLWPGLAGAVAVRAGQLVTLTPATLEQAGLLPPRPLAVSAATKTGSISGRVTGNGKPLAGLCVEADQPSSGAGGLVITSKTGKYRISRLPAGVYQVQFATFGCGADPGNWLPQWYRGINSLFPTRKVTNLRVRAGKNVAGINGKLTVGGEIAGTVRSKSGKKLSGICVDIDGFFQNFGFGVGLSTNKGGFFALHGLFPGRYTAEFTIGCGTKGNYAFQWWRGATDESRATTIKITGHKAVRNIDPVLGPGATVKGTVKGGSATGPLLQGVCVSASGSDENQDSFAITTRRGQYQLEGLAGGRYLIDFDPTCGPPATANFLEDTRSATVKAGRTLSGFNISLPPGATISGKVTDTHGDPLGSVCVDVSNNNEDDGTQTNPNGTYSIAGIQPGKYTVAFFGGCGNATSLAPQFYNNQQSQQTATLVKLTGGKTTANIDAAMAPGGVIAGVVTDEAGHRLNGVCVAASTTAQSGLVQDFADVAFTARGRYRIDNLSPGPYLLEFNCGSPRLSTQWFDAQPDSTTADLLSVSPGVVTPANAKLSKAANITGTVVNTAGSRLGNICVIVFNARNLMPVNGPGSEFATTVRGRYTISGLSPGRYLVQFSDCGDHPRYGSQWYRGKTTAAFATPVKVRAGRTAAGINARLGVGGSVSGVVTGPSNKPLRGICVDAIDNRALSFGFATTDKHGRYSVPGLATGRYSVLFGPCVNGLPNLGTVRRPGLVAVTAPHAVNGINIKLEPGGSVSGTVTSAVAPTAPLSSVCVLLSPIDQNDGTGFALTAQNGRYVARDLAPGQYQAFFGDPFCDFGNEGIGALAPQWFDGQPTQATANDITVTASHTTTGITAALQSFGSITGTVTDAAHAGVSGECVTAVPVNPSLDPFSGTPPAPEIAITTSSGAYTLTDVAAGRYKVEFSAGCGDTGFATQWWNNASSAASASVITVAFTSIPGINATLRH